MISEVLPAPYGRTAYYEIHAQARNQPIVPYQPVIMYMNQGIVELKKVVVATNRVTEIDWCSLER
jgi:alanyl-tRNA synthetase